MSAFSQKLFHLFRSRHHGIRALCVVFILIAILVPRQVKADDVTTSLDSIFGQPDAFITNFESQTKDKADEIIAFLVAAFGFRLVIKSFMG